MKEYHKNLLKPGHVFQWSRSDNIFVITDIINEIVISYDKELGIDEECTIKDFCDSIDDGSLICIFPQKELPYSNTKNKINEIKINDVFIFSQIPELPCIVHNIKSKELYYTKGDAMIRYYGPLENFISDCNDNKIKIIYSHHNT